MANQKPYLPFPPIGIQMAPTPDHYLPLIYIMGASESTKPTVFNQTYNLGSLSMTGFIFEDSI